MHLQLPLRPICRVDTARAYLANTTQSGFCCHLWKTNRYGIDDWTRVSAVGSGLHDFRAWQALRGFRKNRITGRLHTPDQDSRVNTAYLCLCCSRKHVLRDSVALRLPRRSGELARENPYRAGVPWTCPLIMSVLAMIHNWCVLCICAITFALKLIPIESGPGF